MSATQTTASEQTAAMKRGLWRTDLQPNLKQEEVAEASGSCRVCGLRGSRELPALLHVRRSHQKLFRKQKLNLNWPYCCSILKKRSNFVVNESSGDPDPYSDQWLIDFSSMSVLYKWSIYNKRRFHTSVVCYFFCWITLTGKDRAAWKQRTSVLQLQWVIFSYI